MLYGIYQLNSPIRASSLDTKTYVLTHIRLWNGFLLFLPTKRFAVCFNIYSVNRKEIELFSSLPYLLTSIKHFPCSELTSSKYLKLNAGTFYKYINHAYLLANRIINTLDISLVGTAIAMQKSITQLAIRGTRTHSTFPSICNRIPDTDLVGIAASTSFVLWFKSEWYTKTITLRWEPGLAIKCARPPV